MTNRALVVFVVAACGGDSGGVGTTVVDGLPPATLADDPVAAKMWAAMSSTPNVYALATLAVTRADLSLQLGGGTCPVKTVNGDTTVYEGGCTTSSGEMWSGKATQTGTMGSSGSIVYEAFATVGTSDCMGTTYPSSMTYDGDIAFTSGSGATGGRFDANVRATISGPNKTASCESRATTFGIDYQGTIGTGTVDTDGDGKPDDTHWAGSGRIGSMADGRADVETTGEVLNSKLCQKEAISGTTSISSDSHTIAITYDGMTDCNTASTVHWSFDGTDRGELSGVSCNAGGGTGGALLVLVACGLIVRRRPRMG